MKESSAAAPEHGVRRCAPGFFSGGGLAAAARPAAAIEAAGAEAPRFEGAMRPASSDCAFVPSHADPDGRRQRDAVSRTTRAFASAHPVAAGSTFVPPPASRG